MFRSLFGSAAVFFITIVAMVASSAVAAPPSGPTTHKCTSPVSAAKLQDKIDAASEGDVIEVTGHCLGFNYEINTDKLTLRGIADAKVTGDGLAPAITIAADDVIVEDFDKIDGAANNGIVVRAAGSAIVRYIGLLTGNRGLLVAEGAFADIDNVLADSNDDEPGNDGITVSVNGTAKITNTEISGNLDDGLVVISGGAVNLAGGNEIYGNGNRGIIASGGQMQINGENTVENNDRDILCTGFARIAVLQSITSETLGEPGQLFAPSDRCLLFGVGGIQIFVDPTP